MTRYITLKNENKTIVSIDSEYQGEQFISLQLKIDIAEKIFRFLILDQKVKDLQLDVRNINLHEDFCSSSTKFEYRDLHNEYINILSPSAHIISCSYIKIGTIDILSKVLFDFNLCQKKVHLHWFFSLRDIEAAVGAQNY